jgi:hypothetical protein
LPVEPDSFLHPVWRNKIHRLSSVIQANIDPEGLITIARPERITYKSDAGGYKQVGRLIRWE